MGGHPAGARRSRPDRADATEGVLRRGTGTAAASRPLAASLAALGRADAEQLHQPDTESQAHGRRRRRVSCSSLRSSRDERPATSPAPARSPDSTSLGVSPATTSSLTAPPPSRSQAAVSGRSGQAAAPGVGRRQREVQSAGGQRSASSSASLVPGEKPVAMRDSKRGRAQRGYRSPHAPGSG